MDELLEEKPNYYAIIPANVRYDNRLQALAKLLYGEISALSSKYGYCTATNNYFSKLYGVSEKTITRLVKSLVMYGYIQFEIEKIRYENGTIKNQRNIHINHIDNSGFNHMDNHIDILSQNHMDTDVPYNNTSIFNNTSINPLIIPPMGETEKGEMKIYKEIIEYLNTVGKRAQLPNAKEFSFKPTNKETQKLINARLKEKYNIEDFKDVIWYCYCEWVDEPKKFKNGIMSDTYYRPSTIFASKNFENYLQRYRQEYATK